MKCKHPILLLHAGLLITAVKTDKTCTCGYGYETAAEGVTFSSEVSGSSSKAPDCLSTAQVIAAAKHNQDVKSQNKLYSQLFTQQMWYIGTCQLTEEQESVTQMNFAHQTCCATAFQHQPRLHKLH